MAIKIIRRFPDMTKPGFDIERWNRQFHTHNVILNGSYSDIFYPKHWTPLSMKCAFGGTETYITSHVKYGINNSSFLVLNEGTYYDSQISSESKVESFTINFTADFVKNVFLALTSDDSKLLDNPFDTNCGPSFILEKLYSHDSLSLKYLSAIRELINCSNPEHGAITENLHFLLEYLYSKHNSALLKADRLNNVKYSTRIELLKRLNMAKDYINSNYGEKIDLKMLSGISCLSAHHFLRSFKSVFKETPHRTLAKRRISAAENMLINTELTVTEICTAVGFESLSSFGKLFKKINGFSPENFRFVNKKSNFGTMNPNPKN